MKSSNMEHTQAGRTLNSLGPFIRSKVHIHTLPFGINTSLSLVQML